MSAIVNSHAIISRARGRAVELGLQCPQCGTFLGRWRQDEWPPEFLFSCATCHFQLYQEDGIWRGLPPGRAAHFERFLREYETVREAEGRGSDQPEYYLALPYEDRSGHNSQQWEIRARTYQFLEHRILSGLESGSRSALRVLDLGAGNGWMSYRLALRRHQPVAVDVLVWKRDGLGAAVHYRQRVPNLFPRFQAELDCLPFTDNQFDVAIFNASFHYSEDYVETLGEAIRCLRPGGTVIIADTAWYRRDESGLRMIAERREAFLQRYGFASDAIPSLEYLTDRRLKQLEEQFGLRWQTYSPFYGVRWALRPVVAKLKRRREPSRFRIYVAEVEK